MFVAPIPLFSSSQRLLYFPQGSSLDLVFPSFHVFSSLQVAQAYSPRLPKPPIPHFLLSLADQFCPLHLTLPFPSACSSCLPKRSGSNTTFIFFVGRARFCTIEKRKWTMIFFRRDFFPTTKRKSFLDHQQLPLLCASAYTVPSVWSNQRTTRYPPHGPHTSHTPSLSPAPGTCLLTE